MFILKFLAAAWAKAAVVTTATKVIVAVVVVTTATTTVVVTQEDSPITRWFSRNIPGVEVVTGPVPPVFQSSIMGLKVPQGVAVTQDGQWLFVAEGDGDRSVKMIDLNSRAVVRDLVPPGTTPGTRKPMSVAVSAQRIVFVVDRARLVVDMYNEQGQWLGSLGDPPQTAGVWEPLGVGVDSNGNVYVTNGTTGGPFVARYDPFGRYITAVGKGEGAARSLSFPASVATYAGESDSIYVVDSNNARVAVLNGDGEFDYTYGDQAGDEAVGLPRGIAISPDGRCYVTDATAHIVKVWDAAVNPAKYLFDFGEAGSADGEMLYPNAVATDAQGRVYVADTGNDRVQIWGY